MQVSTEKDAFLTFKNEIWFLIAGGKFWNTFLKGHRMSSLEENAVRMIDCLFLKMQVYSENETNISATVLIWCIHF